MDMLILIFCFTVTLILIVLAILTSKQEKSAEAHVSTLRQQAATKPKTVLREKALEDSFMQRVVFPFASNVFEKTQEIIPLTSKSFVSKKLIHAGMQKSHYPKVFLGIQLLSTVLLFGWFLAMSTLFIKMPFLFALILSAAFGLIGYGLPLLWLLQQAQRRQDNIQKSLPDFLDLLVICVEAGLGLDIAINKLANLESVKTSPYLKEELRRYVTDINFGKARKEALLDMAERTGVDDFSAIINALVQAYEMGTGITQTLRVQADSLRVKRLQKAEEKANKIPVKMVIPIYIFLFPTIFVVIFGPMVMILVEVMFGVKGSLADM